MNSLNLISYHFYHVFQYFIYRLNISRKILTETVYREAWESIVIEFLRYISIKHPEFPEKRPKLHVVFILKIIQAIFFKLDNDSITQQYVYCLKLFYRIIPERYAPHEDVKDLLRFILKLSDRKDEIIETYLTTYADLFGVESSTVYAPRSLKHLARCVIRNGIIRNSETVEMAVNHMCIPETLKHFLLGASE